MFFSKSSHLVKNLLAHFAVFALIFEQFIFVASATASELPITPDGTTNTQVTKTASGIDQINIATPDSSGLSHNRYTDYNVNAPGQIINNFSGSASDLTATTIGGLVTANSNLTESGSARVILNEVTSTNISRLLGYVEIAGSKADLILANPNGFTCNGCGFINTAHLMMVAGSSDFSASGGSGFNLKEQLPGIYIPLITVEGLGLDLSKVSSADIIASSVKLLSSIYGSDDNSITIKTGEGRYDYSSKSITDHSPHPWSSAPSPSRGEGAEALFAIDASALAKIQAGQIYLIATKEGIGVKMEAEILAGDSVNINANGDVYYAKVSAVNEVNIKSQTKIESLTSSSSIMGSHVNIETAQFNNKGKVLAYDLKIKNSNVLNFGSIEGYNLDFLNNGNLVNSGLIYGENHLSINAADLSNNALAIIYSFTDLDLNLSSSLNNSGLLISNAKLTINGNAAIDNSGQILANDDIAITARSLDNSLLVQSKNKITLDLATLTNRSDISATKKLKITTSGTLDNQSTLESKEDDIEIHADILKNESSSSFISAAKNLDITATTKITNKNTKPILALGVSSADLTSGIVAKDGIITLKTALLENDGGIVTGKVISNFSDATSNAGGSFIATASIIFDLTGLYTISGEITADHIDITADNILNSGNVTATTYIKLNATSGNITNGYTDVNDARNSNVKLIAGSYIDFTATNNIENYGTIQGTTNTTLTATNGNVNNYAGGQIKGGSGDFTVNALNGNFNNYNITNAAGVTTKSATVTSNNSVIFNVKNFSNSGEISVRNDITTNVSNDFNNNASALIWSGRDATFNVANNFLNQLAMIYAERNLLIQKNNSGEKLKLLKNVSGNIETGTWISPLTSTLEGDLTIRAETIENKRAKDVVNKRIILPSPTNPEPNADWKVSVDWWCGGNFCSAWRKIYVAQNSLNSDSTPAEINAGNRLNLYTKNLINDLSNITSQSNMAIEFSNDLKNEDLDTLVGRIVYVAGHNFTEIYNTTGASNINDRADYENYRFPKLSSSDYSNFSPSIKSGGSITITKSGTNRSDLINGNMEQNTRVTAGSSPDHLTTIVNGVDIFNLKDSGILNLNLGAITKTVTEAKSSDANTVFSGNYKINLDPAATTPLIENRSQFTDTTKFFGSVDYFNALGLDGRAVISDIERQTRTTTRMLGDSYVESHLILDSIKKLTNDSIFLSQNITNSNDQIAFLLDNSVTELTRLGLNAEDVAINGLTADQVKALIKDIVTFELTTIDGIQVLAPKIYLSQETRNRLLSADNALANSSTIYGKDSITIDSPLTNMINSGAIVSAGNVTLNVGSLTNASSPFTSLAGGTSAISKIKSGGDLTILADNNITFKNSVLNSGGTLTIAANKTITIANDKNFAVQALAPLPSLVSATSTKGDAESTRSGLAFNAASDIQITSSDSINVANNYFNSGGSIFMSAINNINNSNYTIKAANDVVMSAGNDINNVHTTESSNETRIEAGNIVSLDAGHDINNIGATIKGGDLVYLTAGHDINNKALVNYTINGSSTNSDGSSITESQALASSARYITSTLISQGSIESDSNLVMVAANDINVKGSNVSSVGDSYLEATNGNINVTTAELREKTFAEGGSKKKHWESITDNTTNVESNITSGRTLNLLASGTTPPPLALVSESGNINITGSKLTSADNLTLAAKNDITISSAQDSSYSFAAGRTGRGKSYLNKSESVTQVESELTTTNDGNISITSGVGNTDAVGSDNAHGSIALIASKLATKDIDGDASNNVGSGDVTLTAKEDLTIASALDTRYSESHSSKKGFTVKTSSTTIDGSETNISSEINATGDVATTSGDDTNIIASNLAAQGSGSIASGGETNIFNAIDTTTHYSNVSKEQKGILKQMPIISQTVQAFQVVDGGLWNGISGGNLDKGDNLWGNNKDRVSSTATTENIVTSNLNFANDLTINSDQNLAVRSSNLESTTGNITLTSNSGDVSVTAATANNSATWHANNKTDRSKAVEERVNNSGTVTSSEITAGKNVTITSVEGDAVLQAAKVTSGTENLVGEQNVAVNATNGNIYLLAGSNTSQSTHTDKSKGTYSFSDGTTGHINSEVVNNKITAGNTGSTTFNTENQIIAQYKNTGSGSDVSVFADDSKLSYLSSLDPAKTTYDPVSNQTINWDQTTRGLTSTGTAVVAVGAVAATIASAGAAGVAVAGAAGATTAAAGATVTAASLTLGGTIIAASTAAIITTAAATAAVSATNASMNADGNFLGSLDDVGKTTLKDTTSKDAMRNYAIAGITAGVTAGISEYAGITEMSRAANTANTVDGARTAEQVLQNAKVSLYESAISNTTSTIVQSAVNGESPSDTLSNLALNIAVGAVSNAAAKEIGNAAHGSIATDANGNVLRNSDGSIVYNAPKISTAEQLTLHAALGCASGAAQGGNCTSGAAAGVVGEMTAEAIGNSGLSNDQIAQLSGLTGAASALVTGAITGQDDKEIANSIFSGQRIATNAAQNNYLQGKMMDESMDKAWLEGKITDAEYQDYKQARHQGEMIAGGIALGAVTLGEGTALAQGGKAIVERMLSAKMASATVNGIAGASGGAWGAYVGGGDTNQILKSAGTTGLISAGIGFFYGSHSLVNGVSIGAASGLFSSIPNTYQTNPNATGMQYLNNGLEGTLGGALVGFTGAAFTPANSGLAGQIIGAQTALPIDMFLGVIGNKYDLLPTPRISNSHPNQ